MTDKTILQALPEGWRSTLWAAIPKHYTTGPRKGSNHDLAMAVAISWLTGARTAEINAGVLVRRVQGRPALEIAIQGAKHDTVPVAGGGTAQRGYPFRILTVAADANEAAQWLYDAMAEGANWRRFQYNQSTYRNSLTSWGMRIFGVAGLCPYAFRHQMGEELKTSDAVTLLEAAQAMGHHSAATLWRYGNGRRGRHTRRPFVRVYVPEPRPAAPAPGLKA